MAARPEPIPILVGGGQLVQRDVDPTAAREPMDLMVDAARAAAADAGGDGRLLGAVDTLAVVNVIGSRYCNAPRLLAERLGIRPAEEVYTTVGGNTPQWLVNETAAKIRAGRVGLALLAGAEAMHTLGRARRAGVRLVWTADGAGSPTVVGDARPGSNLVEMNHGLVLPAHIYPLFENALRAQRGLTIDEHRRRLGAICARLSAVAADNPYAWFRKPRSATEIATVTETNRMIGFPYPKYMNAILEVDQAAAVLVTSVARARELGIHPSRWVYLRGAAEAHDLWYLSERADYTSSPALRAAAARAVALAGVDVDGIAYLDLYSCFPSAVAIAREALGIGEDDPRPLTVTGGLAYAGGPGNNYSMHAIATMMARLRAAPRTVGLVTALGWYVTKHAVGVYSVEPGTGDAADAAEVPQAALDRQPHPDLAVEAQGPATVETYTVVHDRTGAPEQGIVIGRLPDGRRFVARTPADRDVLEALMREEGVGRPGTVRSADGTNRFDPG